MHFLCGRAVLGYPRRHAAFPVRRTLPLTTEASQLSVGIAEDSGTA